MAKDLQEAERIMQRLSAEHGWPGACVALDVWCDILADHSLGPGTPPQPFGLDIEWSQLPESRTRPAHEVWAGRYATAHAAWDEAAKMAILGELPRDPWEVGLHVSAVLGLVAGIIREGWLRAHTSTPPREKVQITTNHQGAPHNWRDCWLRTVATPEIG